MRLKKHVPMARSDTRLCKRHPNMAIAIFLFLFLRSSLFQTSELLQFRQQPSTSDQQPPSSIQVFYNVYVREDNDRERVMMMIDEQLSSIDRRLHKTPVLVTSIGRPIGNISQLATIREHQPQGSEALTLRAIWNYCREHPSREAKVVYVHSKGSYHDNDANSKLRSFLTKGALSQECANLLQSCDVCSSHMSPLPHPHTPGNMWLARCDYISTLIDPYALHEGKLPKNFHADVPCKGFGRSFYEHWVHSHPGVKPCDLYSGKDFTYGYESIPESDFVHDLKLSPRWEFDFYNQKRVCARHQNDTERDIRWNYLQLYNITWTPDRDWWLWEFFGHASPKSI